jgi:DNA-binding response OmpR family regulator
MAIDCEGDLSPNLLEAAAKASEGARIAGDFPPRNALPASFTRSSSPESAAPVPESPRVALVMLDTSIPTGPLQERLGADAAEVELWSAAILRHNPPAARMVVVACLAPSTPDPALRALVAWCERGTEPVGVIGYAPAGTAEDAERALAAGFDDVIAGRDSPRELSARVRAVARRSRRANSRAQEHLRVGRITLDLGRHELLIGSVSAALTPLELLLMRALMEARGRPLSREQLLGAVWGTDDVGPRAVDNLVWRLRRKLGNAKVFAVVRGVGFRLLSD